MGSKHILREEETPEEVKNRKRLEFFSRFQALIETKAMKQSDLAHEIGVSRQYLNGIVKFRIKPSSSIKLKISKKLGVDSSILWGFFGDDLYD